MVEPVEQHDPDGIDYGWVMQTTFVMTIVVGAPLVALLSLVQPLPTWGARAGFAVRVGAVVWFLTAIAVYAYAAVSTDDESESDSNDTDDSSVESDQSDKETDTDREPT